MEENKTQMLYGIHPVMEAIRAGRTFDKVLLKQGMEGEQFRQLYALIGEKKINCQFVPVERLNRAVRGAHQGVVAYVSQIELVGLEEMVEKSFGKTAKPLLVILDGVSDVRNLGAVSRTLECVGGNGIIVPAKGGAAINAEAVKASAGALTRIDACRVPNLRYAAYYLKQAGFRIVAASEKVDKLIYDADLKGPVAIVMGSEGKGISSAMLELADEKVAIPMSGNIGSLNVSIAAAVVMYEAVRQRLA